MTAKRLSPGEDFDNFCVTTSAHGFSYLPTPSKPTKICWIIIIVLAFVFGVLHLYSLVSQYLQYEYHETIDINTETVPVFPDVTICDNAGIADSSFAR